MNRFPDGLIVDLFAGGGGASTGIEAALGIDVDIAINHDEVALAVHRANHPNTRHLEADIWEVKPREAVGGQPVALLWASPDCTHFSVARGAKPRKQGIRSLAWAVVMLGIVAFCIRILFFSGFCNQNLVCMFGHALLK